MFICRHVLKEFRTTVDDLHTRLWPVYRYISAVQPPNCISIQSAKINNQPVLFANDPPAEEDVTPTVQLYMRPVGAAPITTTPMDILSCFSCVLLFLQALHEAGFCHRDIRIDNVIRCAGAYTVIDLELAAANNQPVFWASAALPEGVSPAGRAYVHTDDLWQLGRMILRLVGVGADERSIAIRRVAEDLVDGRVASARDALQLVSQI